MNADGADPSLSEFPRTRVDEPRRRIFMPQTFAGRAASACWTVVRTLLFRPTPRRLNRWRVFLLRLFGAKVHPSVSIDRTALVHFPWNLTVGPHVHIHHKVIINCMGPIEIGQGARISQYSHLCAGTHEYQRADMRIKPCPIKVGRDVWLAADVFVGPGVAVGDRAIVGARTSVFKDLPADMIAVGEPARPIRPRQPSD